MVGGCKKCLFCSKCLWRLDFWSLELPATPATKWPFWLNNEGGLVSGSITGGTPGPHGEVALHKSLLALNLWSLVQFSPSFQGVYFWLISPMLVYIL